MTSFAVALAALPTGTFRGTSNGRRYVVTKTVLADSRTTKLIAEELGGADYISLNHFALTSGTRLKPCEMSADKVTAFVQDLVPDP
ncbi:hypothetical protein [uncultured Tateyamaria sp.]|uniref:hypothetical protein n=1 Tax=Tateyamaria sp. 1078 TaxID=3417464 RepID=UPI0026022373|nr:hypothetical protein [uncultured Tateyamaria sp.]